MNNYVNEMDKASLFQNNFSYVNEIINSIDDMEIKKEDYEQVIKNMKNQIDNIILTNDLEETIINDFNNSKFREIYRTELWARCYGIYNGAVVLFVPLNDLVITTIVVENYEFYYTSYFTILVWHNNDFYAFEFKDDVKKLIDNNILTINDIEKINKIHNEWAN